MEVYWDYLVAGFISPKRPGCFFFVVAPFCSCPASLVSRKFFAVGPGCAKCFFFVALRWAPRPFGGARAKKKTPPRVFFFCSGPGERQGKEKPRWKPARGQSKKKTPPRVFFFAAAPAKGKGRRSPVGSRHGARAKQKTPPRVFFFAPAPGKGRGRRSPVGRRHGARAKFFFFFLLWPRAGFQRGFSFPCLSPGPEQKKKHPGWCFFFCSGPVPASNGASPSLAFPRGRSKKKKHPGWCFFFALAPCRLPTELLLPLPFPGAAAKKKNTLGGVFFFCCGPARTLTHSLRAWVAMPPPRRGGVFFFCCGPARTGVVFFFCGPARTLTHSRWAGAISARPGWCFVFLLRPRRVFLDNSKKCLGYYIGSKKTRRGHSKKKKNTTSSPKKSTVSVSVV